MGLILSLCLEIDEELMFLYFKEPRFMQKLWIRHLKKCGCKMDDIDLVELNYIIHRLLTARYCKTEEFKTHFWVKELAKFSEKTIQKSGSFSFCHKLSASQKIEHYYRLIKNAIVFYYFFYVRR